MSRRKREAIPFIDGPVQARWMAAGRLLERINPTEFDKLLGLAELFLDADKGSAGDPEPIFAARLRFLDVAREGN